MCNEVCQNQDDIITGLIKDTFLYDATQKKLQQSYATPYIGWHPVNDRMTTKMHYDVTAMSWGRKAKREYGIPSHRKK